MAESSITVTQGTGTTMATITDGSGNEVPKVNLAVDNGSSTSVDASVAAGNVDTGTLRVTIATDDANLATLSSLSKAVDSVAGATDTGIVALAKHKEDLIALSTADGDYDHLTLDSLGQLHVNPEGHHIFDNFNATTGWSALGNDTLNLATTGKHAIGTAALTFDKVDGAANTVFAGIEKTVSSVDLGDISPHDLIHGVLYIPDLSDVSYAFIRIGTDSSNYNEWRIADTNLTAATFETYSLTIGDADHTGITGNGWDPSAITYIAVGVAFDAESNTLAGIIFDQLSYHTNQHTSAQLNNEVTSSINSANVNINKVGNKVVDTQAGNVSTGTQRITIATDDANLSAIKTAVEIIDNAISTNEMQCDILTMDHGKTIKSAYGSTTASGNTTMVASAGASTKIKVTAFSVTTDKTDASTYKFTSGAGGTNLWGGILQSPSGASAGANLAVPSPGQLFETSANKSLVLNWTGSSVAHWAVTYVEES